MSIELLHDIAAVRRRLSSMRHAGRPVALVPTMGYLHEGHAALIRQAAELAPLVVVSVFVNPLQFGPNEDLDRYPRNLDGDLRLAEDSGAHVVFAPSAAEFTPAGLSVSVHPGRMGDVLCGRARPGHFVGVCTIVAKLFNVIQPDVAVFGWKDAQQFLILSAMVRGLDIPVRMVGVETVRDSDGLALSSRNSYLSVEERREAPAIHRALCAARDAISADPGIRAENVCRMVADRIRTETRGEIDYVEMVSCSSLAPIERPARGDTLLAVAVRFPSARLIDNIRL